MQATIYTISVNERLSEYIHFVHSHYETQENAF